MGALFTGALGPALPTPQPVPAAMTPSGPLARYLAHPGATTARIFHHLAQVLAHLPKAVGAGALAVTLIGVVAVTLARRTQARRMGEGARLVRVLTPPEVDPQGAATLWTNLVALLRPAWRRFLGGQPHLGFELTASDGGLTIALWVPGQIPPGLVERAVEAAWPGARTETVPAIPPLSGPGVATGGALSPGASRALPAAHRAQGRPAPPAAGRPGGPRRGRVRLCPDPRPTGHRPAPHPAAAGCRGPALRAARHPHRPARRPGHPGAERAGARQRPEPQRGRGRHLGQGRPAVLGDQRPLRAVHHRHRPPGRRTPPRPSPCRRLGVRALCRAEPLRPPPARPSRPCPRRAPVRPWRPRLGGRAGRTRPSAHRCQRPRTRPGGGQRGRPAARGGPPRQLTVALPASYERCDTPKLLGDAQAGGRRPVALAVPDARYHLHVMGATGSGKSTLLTNLVLGDIAAGRGVVVIDPKGDLITDLCDRLPDGAESRTVLIDPEDPDAAPVLNVLAGPDPDLAVDNLVGIFRSIFAAFWGPRTDDVLRSACLTLLRYAASSGTSTSLADVPRLLADNAFRAPRVAAVADDTVGLGGFWDSYEAMTEANRAQVIGPVMNKLRAFLLRDFVRSVVGRPDSSFDMGQVLDGGICLVRVPKGILGEETARLLGSFVVAKVWQTATHRARLGQAARVDASLVVDECQNFLHLPRSFDEMLAEARGYRLSMVLAHQHLGQLPRELREAVSSNARTKVWFSMSPEDAHALSRHVAPEVSEHDLSHLGAYTAAARLVVDGEETPAFTLRTRPAPPAIPGRAQAVRDANRAAHSRPETKPARPVLAGRTLPAPSPANASRRRGGCPPRCPQWAPSRAPSRAP